MVLADAISGPYIVLKLNRKGGYCKFIYSVSAIFLLLVSTYMLVGCLLSPFYSARITSTVLAIAFLSVRLSHSGIVKK